MFSALPPLGLYVHLPWCVRKCPYCDFNSHACGEEGGFDEAVYVEALIRDLDAQLPLVWGRVLQSVFFGGGTPSLFSPEAIGRLLQAVRARFRCVPDLEVTLEANPGTAEAGRFRGFFEAGVNRLSLGVQSFDDGALQALGRIHDGAQAHTAVAMARDAGFRRLNLDLMFGLPGQDWALARADLSQALAYEPEHVSFYELTLEPNTLFAHQPPRLPDEAVLVAIGDGGVACLEEAGLGRYEVSAFARQGGACRHNVNYWAFGDYLGIGAGAHSKLTRADSQSVVRFSKRRHPRDFVEHAGGEGCVEGWRVLSGEDLRLEFLLNGLRLVEGVSVADFEARTGLSVELLQPQWGQLVERGLLRDDARRLATTASGLRFLNDVLAAFDQPLVGAV